ncbi:hypothetical protein AH06_229 [Erwinia phage AH06]|nr:hypothetical protein AH06_229 [Erwinia phage AH06]
MNANTLVIDLKPIIYKWFAPTSNQANEMDIKLALDDLLTYAGTHAVDQECDLDLIGPTYFLQNSGWKSDVLQTLINEVSTLTRSIYLTQCTPEWRNAGVKHIQVDRFYLMTVKLGIDPYA